MDKKVKIKWFVKPEEHDYPAAKSYLRLVIHPSKVDGIVARLKKAPMSTFKAKDVFRASGLSLLGVSNSHVKKNCKKIDKGQKLSPILLVVDSVNGKVIIADGYHRLCAVYRYNENILIPCKIEVI